jgi:hypothetical protein
MRLLNLLVIAALILAASFVYKIKFDSTLQAERVGKIAAELRRERNAIASLRAEWGKLDAPDRIQGLAERHLALKPMAPTQFDSLDRLPDKPLTIIQPPIQDPIGAMIGSPSADATGSIPKPKGAR